MSTETYNTLATVISISAALISALVGVIAYLQKVEAKEANRNASKSVIEARRAADTALASLAIKFEVGPRFSEGEGYEETAYGIKFHQGVFSSGLVRMDLKSITANVYIQKCIVTKVLHSEKIFKEPDPNQKSGIKTKRIWTETDITAYPDPQNSITKNFIHAGEQIILKLDKAIPGLTPINLAMMEVEVHYKISEDSHSRQVKCMFENTPNG